MEKRRLVEDGRLTVPLFHGTSSLHYDSIRSHGLGGRNAIVDMGIRKAARLLLEMSADYSQDEEWQSDIAACKPISADPANDRLGNASSGFSFSFRYGGTYLSASRETAATYSLLYPEGGEALTHVLKLHRRLSALRPDVAAGDQFAQLIDFVAPPVQPLLVEARDIPLHCLRTEQGSGIEFLLDRMEEALQDPDYYDFLVGQHNFELTQAVPIDQLRFHTVRKALEFDDDGGSRQVFEFHPFEES